MPNRAVFVTGAAAGIGRATALTFAKNGYTVGGYEIDEVGLKSPADEIDEVGLKSPADEIDDLGGTALTGHLDVTDPTEMAQRVGEFAKATGRLDVMINNAGILLAGNFEDIDVAKHLKEVDINAKGVVNGLHAAFPYLRDTDNSVVVNLSSASAI
jgi:NADP-dependent 3-hydroxy acid dehydrogenase YdfG